MGMLLTMEILRVASLLLPFFFYTVFCFPSRPLNERSTELAWQAWLLVDDQNQNKHYDPETFTRRRITPKSVFIAPTFTPESLPACAEDYRPDSMGRCIKIIKLDEEAHSKFLLERLNAQFGNYDEIEEDSQEGMATAGPFQLNIPLDDDEYSSTEEQYQDRPGNNVDIAIVVAPTNGNFGLEDRPKPSLKNTTLQIIKKTPEAESHHSTNSNINSKRKTEPTYPTTEDIEETTTNNIETTTPYTTSTIVQTYDNNNNDKTEISTITSQIETTTFAPTTTTTIATTLDIQEADTTISDQDALFFLKPTLSNTKHVQNGTRNADDTPVIASGDHSFIIANHSLTTLPSNSTNIFTVSTSFNLSNKRHVEDNVNIKHNNKDDRIRHPVSNSGDLMTSENLHHSSEAVRFPVTEEEPAETLIDHADYIKFPEKLTHQLLPNVNTYASRFQHGLLSSSNVEHSTFPYFNAPSKNQQTSEQLSTFFNDYLHSRGADLKGNERFVFKNHDSLTFPNDNLETNLKQEAHKTYANSHDQLQLNSGYGSNINDRVYNHRNRDKHISLWSLPSSLSESSPQKPIVLRFSGRSGNGRHLLEELLLPHTQDSQAIYREVPSQDFSFIFGTNHQNHNRRRIPR